ncbi:laccase domain-containing protein [Methylobacter sp.]|uniref:polyphenol oxidase family protein n=1 Tax=Methylobacter sp. TaxID=2051955 RepID=UPI00120E6F67|nr:laccase domain-containing protein [Methylobacter sp.]TAK64894.1 MAG: hypothetical protein EPO18_01590 [Methylobacter sp.]
MNGIKHWLAPDWPAPANIHAATTLRSGGASCGAYASLNPAMHVGDDVDLVKQNRQLIKELLTLPSDPVWLDQIHSNRAVQVHSTFAKGGRGDLNLQQADAGYTAESGVVCAVLTADCLPLLVCAADGSQVAAIHAGWRGLLRGVIGNTITAMEIPPSPPFTKGEVSQPHLNLSFIKGEAAQLSNIEPNPPLCKRGARGDFLVWLGPAIGPNCFEVGAEVRDAFLKKSTKFTTAFTEQSNGKWLADIYQLARIDLAMLGIDKIYGGGFCTVTEHERFYSYRRDKQTGRMATLIWRE